jgi:hypothetical protein
VPAPPTRRRYNPEEIHFRCVLVTAGVLGLRKFLEFCNGTLYFSPKKKIRENIVRTALTASTPRNPSVWLRTMVRTMCGRLTASVREGRPIVGADFWETLVVERLGPRKAAPVRERGLRIGFGGATRSMAWEVAHPSQFALEGGAGVPSLRCVRYPDTATICRLFRPRACGRWASSRLKPQRSSSSSAILNRTSAFTVDFH